MRIPAALIVEVLILLIQYLRDGVAKTNSIVSRIRFWRGPPAA